MASNRFIHENLNRMSEESIKNTPGSNNTFASSWIAYSLLPHAKFAKNCLRLRSILLRKNVVNLDSYHTRDTCSRDLNTDFTLGNGLFGVVKLTKNPDPDKYGYSGYRIGFDAHLQFSLPNGTWDKNVIIFGVVNSYSVHVDNKKKDILALDEGPPQRVNDSGTTTETKYSVNFKQQFLIC